MLHGTFADETSTADDKTASQQVLGTAVIFYSSF